MKLRIILSLIIALGLCSCSPVKTVIDNEYQLSLFSAKYHGEKKGVATLLVTTPDAISGYDTEEMLYIKKPFKVEAFSKNAWLSPPADMIYPLITQSLQRSGAFYAVATSPYGEATDYRLDSQLIRLQQNFLKKPSEIDLVLKVVLTDVGLNKVIGSTIISQHVRCPMDTPY
ncbi:MAG: hypothetical protein EPN84_07800, partial [Legionella sp.]